jgi:hypothetical protein
MLAYEKRYRDAGLEVCFSAKRAVRQLYRLHVKEECSELTNILSDQNDKRQWNKFYIKDNRVRAMEIVAHESKRFMVPYLQNACDNELSPDS